MFKIEWATAGFGWKIFKTFVRKLFVIVVSKFSACLGTFVSCRSAASFSAFIPRCGMPGRLIYNLMAISQTVPRRLTTFLSLIERGRFDRQEPAIRLRGLASLKHRPKM